MMTKIDIITLFTSKSCDEIIKVIDSRFEWDQHFKDWINQTFTKEEVIAAKVNFFCNYKSELPLTLLMLLSS